jgi:NAD(P)-dependent dehydrogenase (short-subunit alcohol dehydrogenase family)
MEAAQPMKTRRTFIAGASGVIGRRLVPLLVAQGHTVAGMTRSPDRVDALRALGAEPVVCDVFDADALTAAVAAFAPDTVIHQLTDLPDDPSLIPALAGRNARMRREGTHNLIAAARAAGAARFLAQSVAWDPQGDGAAAKRELESSVLEIGGVVLRYGQLYGPGTYYEDEQPSPPRVHVDEAARRTVAALEAASGIVTVVD